MPTYIVETKEDVVPLLKTLLPQNCVVSNGGSMSLAQCGAMQLLRSGAYQFLDRDAEGVDTDKLFRQVFNADAYFSSANAITEEGEVYLVDACANRVSAVAYGPSSVILVVGHNKIVSTLADAKDRLQKLAAPANAARLHKKTPCATTGICSQCSSPDRICRIEMVLQRQSEEGRIKVILVNEALGY